MSAALPARSMARPVLSPRVRINRALRLGGKVVFAVVLVGFVMAPLIGVLSTSFTTSVFWEFPPQGFTLKWYQSYASTRELIDSTFTSLEAAAFVGIAGPAVAVLTALALTRSRIRRTASDAVNVATLIPLLVPTIALGLAIYLLYITAHIPVNLFTLGAAQLILVLPLVTGLLVTGLDGIRPNIERAAANLGAGPASVVFRITVPLLRPALVAAAIIAFVRSFDDSAIALFINSPDTTTLPIRMLLDMTEAIGPLIAVCGSVLLLIAVALAVILDRVIGLTRAFGLRQQ
jgi:ABC-type spermidine/putrescine transport system permease subunit II